MSRRMIFAAALAALPLAGVAADGHVFMGRTTWELVQQGTGILTTARTTDIALPLHDSNRGELVNVRLVGRNLLQDRLAVRNHFPGISGGIAFVEVGTTVSFGTFTSSAVSRTGLLLMPREGTFEEQFRKEEYPLTDQSIRPEHFGQFQRAGGGVLPVRVDLTARIDVQGPVTGYYDGAVITEFDVYYEYKAVPEPATLSALLVGLLVMRRRRARRG